MKVKLLVVADCPNEAPAWALLRRALDESNLEQIHICTEVITDTAEATRINFLGSPSFSVSGLDLFADPVRQPGITCRVYPTANGPAGLPGLAEMKVALRQIDRWS